MPIPIMNSEICAQVREDLKHVIEKKTLKRKTNQTIKDYDLFIQQVLISTVALGKSQEHR